MLTTHHGSHAALVTNIDAADVVPGELDAIIVPTVRPGWHLTSALEVAAELDRPLLCLSSKGSDPADILKVADSVGAEAIVIDTTEALPKLLPDFATTKLIRERGFGRSTDLSGKRNLGLLIARAMNWRKILFLDDDIRQVTARDLRALGRLLDSFAAVGLGNTGYPDNSVVCHAFRAVDGQQDTFVSGGLLSVRADRLDGFFPDIYNEDWFFLHSTRDIARTGAAFQDRYDPFVTPNRATDEELGDCLAEGVYWLRDEGKSPATAREEAFWSHYLDGRRQLIDEVRQRLETKPADEEGLRERQLASMAAARDVHRRITSELCTAIIRAWESDTADWRGHRAQTPAGTSVEDCLRLLEKRHHPGSGIDWDARVHRSR
ncbi:hypothetical protein [Stackebrandtia nassauensis]|uniref:Glycosyltransferase 2-like domain-containing protein n=1 Tax=Stackebrandtia nassauensis (strain DSM 44728 / CIP 108903 / NRRL B-16338 / NBRC 102104 / LLR-40K-21) TaxID=446470 RepID=D3Q563_STANL|nr:hypothetical protein [Stackebrandtia nassauensis]ADD44112.1 hypothetical protein Snas_4467 [Stackebrandtia nassauensis DSM 44728]